MQVIYKPIYKTVKYAGEEIVVPTWVEFIATNSDGGVWGFSQRPTFVPNRMFDPKEEGGKWLGENEPPQNYRRADGLDQAALSNPSFWR